MHSAWSGYVQIFGLHAATAILLTYTFDWYCLLFKLAFKLCSG